MPIHLPPLSRRSFLKRSALAAAALWPATNLFAARKRTNPHSWAMLADTHIAANPAQLGRGLNMTDHLAQACREILALDTAPAGMIVHGDCAFSTGQTGDYEQLLKLLDPVRQSKLPVHLALGNHDHRERFYHVVRQKAASSVPDKHVSLVKSDRVNFFILDSLNEIPSNPGLLGRQQLQWLHTSLDKHRTKPAVVVVHHNPNRLLDAEELIDVMDRRKHVKAMFHGHIHAWWLRETPGGVHMVNLPPVSYPTNPDGPTGWVHATFARDGVRLDVHCTNSNDPLHRSIHELKWRAA